MTPQAIAQWMLEELGRAGILDQELIVHSIATKFGKEFTYFNENGNLSIDRRVLREFRKLTEGTVVWERGEKFWRFRTEKDPKGRMAED